MRDTLSRASSPPRSDVSVYQARRTGHHHLHFLVSHEAGPWLVRLRGLELVVPVEADDGEVGDDDDDVGEDVAHGEECPEVEPVLLTGGSEVHSAGVEIPLVHVP